MNQNITNYIQKQMETAKLEHERSLRELAEATEREETKVRQVAIENILRALHLLGIDTDESTLSDLGSGEVYFSYGHFRISVPSIVEIDVTDTDASRGYRPYHLTDFNVYIRVIVPDEIREEYLELHLAGAGTHPLFKRNGYDYDEVFSLQRHTINIHSELGANLEILPAKNIAEFFTTLHQLGVQYQATYESYQKWAVERREMLAKKAEAKEIAALISPRFAYEGDDIAEILARVLRDFQAEYYPEVEF